MLLWLMTKSKLNGKQRRFLRGKGHALEPVVLVGKEGVTDALVGAVGAALGTHELVKIKVGGNSPEGRHEVAEALATRTDSELVQVLGNTVLLYRPDPEEPKIELPRP
jgi:RNA-binding protein